MSFEEQEEDNNPFTNGLSQMDFPYKERLEPDEEPASEESQKLLNTQDDVEVKPKKVFGQFSPLVGKMAIEIVDANKSSDGHSANGYITYTISYNDKLIRRRYREFESFRNALLALFPTLLVPPIPTKQTITEILSTATGVSSKTAGVANLGSSTSNLDTLVSPLDSSFNIIDHRKRMLSIFLNRCMNTEKIRQLEIFSKFLDPNINWNEVLHQPPLTLIPKSNLQCDPIHPEKSVYLHSLMPIPASGPITILKNNAVTASSEDELELNFRTTENSIMSELDKIDKKCNRYLADISNIAAELAILFNGFSLQESDQLASLLEKVSTIYDQDYLNLENLYKTLYLNYSEPLIELAQFSDISKKLMKFKKKKYVQLQLINENLAHKEKSLKNSTVGQNNQWLNSKLDQVLSKFDPNEVQLENGAKNAPAKFKIPGVNKITSVFKERVYDGDPVKTHQDKVNKLIFDINQLKKVQELAGNDYKKLEAEINKELLNYEKYFKSVEFKKLLLQLVKNMLEYGKKNLDNWEEFKRNFD